MTEDHLITTIVTTPDMTETTTIVIEATTTVIFAIENIETTENSVVLPITRSATLLTTQVTPTSRAQASASSTANHQEATEEMALPETLQASQDTKASLNLQIAAEAEDSGAEIK
jgi:hypothetical protein